MDFVIGLLSGVSGRVSKCYKSQKFSNTIKTTQAVHPQHNIPSAQFSVGHEETQEWRAAADPTKHEITNYPSASLSALTL